MTIENGKKVWRNPAGELHRTDGPARETDSGSKEWWVEGQLHRVDGSAIEYFNGDKELWVNGQLHRTDGPAVETAYGTKEWWANGKQTSKQKISYLLSQQDLKIKVLSQVVNPFCEINVAKYAL
jgi:hypothetical protein